jgi:cytochrome P450
MLFTNLQLARLNPVIDVEVKEAMSEEMPACEDWTSVHIYMKLVNAVAKVSGRVFVGPDLCRNKDYLDAAVNYTMDFISARSKIQDMRPWLRPFLAPRLKEVRQLAKREEMARKIIYPVVQARRDAENNDPDYKKPEDMLQWLMNRLEESGDDSIERLAKSQLGLIFAAIHTTTLTATNM